MDIKLERIITFNEAEIRDWLHDLGFSTIEKIEAIVPTLDQDGWKLVIKIDATQTK